MGVGISVLIGLKATSSFFVFTCLTMFGFTFLSLPFLHASLVSLLVSLAAHPLINLPMLLGKNPDGSFPIWAIVMFSPFLYFVRCCEDSVVGKSLIPKFVRVFMLEDGLLRLISCRPVTLPSWTALVSFPGLRILRGMLIFVFQLGTPGLLNPRKSKWQFDGLVEREQKRPIFVHCAYGSFINRAVQNDFNNNDKTERGLLDMHETPNLSSDQDFTKSGPIWNRGKKKELLLDDDVGGNVSLRATSTLGNNLLGGAKGKRSGREPKQKTDQISTSGNGFVGRITEATPPLYPSISGSDELITSDNNKKRGVGLMSPGSVPQDSFKDVKEPVDFRSLQIQELDSIEALGVGGDLGGPQDLSSWLNFDEDGLQDHDSMGLEIPMDDLSDLNMIL